MTTCCVDNCDHDAYSGNSKCILHCDKGDYASDRHMVGFLKSFDDALIDRIVNSLFEYTDEIPNINKIVLTKYLNATDTKKTNTELINFAKESTVVLAEIVFPQWDSRDNFNYTRYLNKLGSIHFNYCEFKSHDLTDQGIRIFFQNCQFHDDWHIVNALVLENVNNVLYQDCIFYGNASAYTERNGIGHINQIHSQLFNNCDFRKELSFNRINFSFPIFNNTDDVPTKIKEIKIVGCTIDSKFILNNCTIDKFLSEDTVFKSKFEFKQNTVSNFEITNSNFFELVDTYKTKYRMFKMHKSICEDFVGFENCEFGEANNNSKGLLPRFLYATFTSFVNFRNTEFHSGLDIEHVNLKESPNFLNAKINPTNSNRETFRIIKNSFDEIGNHIEANKFFVLEMKKYKEELAGTNQYQERCILFLNEIISNFGQSYMRPIFMMIAASFIYFGLVFGYEKEALYKIYIPANDCLSAISALANNVSKNILPFSRFLKNGMESVSLAFYIIFVSLAWQIVVAVKRHTRR
ncbi:MAG: hypothetical protein ABL869_00940 [Candidatus Nitrotoga sp.]